MDVAVFELLRAGKADAAAAQTIQNLKAKVQAVLLNGEWDTAWLLTRLPAPLQRKEWAVSKEEMTVVSGYVETLAKLRKKVRENRTGKEDDDDEAAASCRK